MDKNFDTALAGRLLAKANIQLKPEYKKETLSTQSDAREYIKKNGVQRALFVTDRQTAGHGRLNRGWFDAGTKSLCLSLLFRPKIAMPKIPLINYAAALAVKQTLFCAAKVDAELKWPNDLLINGRKVCGIISETSAVFDSLFFVITGVGLNVNCDTRDFPPNLRGTATSLKIETAKEFSREELAAEFTVSFFHFAQLLESDPCALLDDYRKNCATIGQNVRAICAEGIFEGIAENINSDGSLLINRNGEKRAFFAADIVHLRNG